MPERKLPRPEFLWWLASLALVIATLGALFIVPYLPTHDGPQHIYAAWAQNHWDSLAVAHERLRLNPDRVSALGFEWLFRPLERMLPWRGAYMSTLGLLVVINAFGLFAAATRAAKNLSQRSLVWLAIPLTLPWMLYMGFLNYIAGLALVGWVLWLTLAALAGHEQAGARGLIIPILALTAVMWTQSRAHAFAAALTGLLVFSMVTSAAVARRSLTLFGAFALPAIPVVAVGYMASTGGRVASAMPAEIDAEFRLELALTTLTGGNVQMTVLFLLIGIALAAYAVVRPAETWARGLGLAALALIALHLAAPFDIPGWLVFAPRFGVPGVAAGIIAACGAQAYDGRLLARATPAFTGGVALVWAASTGMMHDAVYDDCADAFRPMILTQDANLAFFPMAHCGGSDVQPMPVVHWLRNADAVHAMDNGGLPDVYYGSPAIHAFVAGEHHPVGAVSDWASMDALALEEAGDLFGDPADQPRDWLYLTAYLARAIAERDMALLYGEVVPHLRLFERGFMFESDSNRPHVYILRFIGCRATIEFDGSMADLSARARFYPDEVPIDIHPRELSSGAWLVTTPCGPTAIEVWNDVDGDGLPSDDEPHCTDDNTESEMLRIIRYDELSSIWCSFPDP